MTDHHVAPTTLNSIRPGTFPCAAASSVLPPSAFSLVLLPAQSRHASNKTKRPRLSSSTKSGVNPRKPKDLHKQQLGELTRADERQELEANMRKSMMATKLESASIFDEDLKNISTEEEEHDRTKAETAAAAAALAKKKANQSLMGASLISDHVRHAVDPDPRSRRRWERKMVIRHVNRCLDVRGRETKEERIKRTEREVLSKSTWLATSTKKLMYLARQISGKTLEEARTQMKFSKKKFAREVLFELDLARDKGVVERGMGLGKVTGEFVPGETEKKTIRDHRHGKWVDIIDPTRLYVHEAWVNRGPWRGKRPSFRARGRVDLIQMPQASKLQLTARVCVLMY